MPMTRPPLATLLFTLALAGIAQAETTPDLQGLWQAHLRFGPEVQGALVVQHTAKGWWAEIGGLSVPAIVDPHRVAFELPDGKGSFHGTRDGAKIRGHWVQPERYATPVTLEPDGSSRWRGNVVPLENAFTFYMPITREADGTYRTFLRNPERNIGWFTRVSRLEARGDSIRLIGRAGKQNDATLAEGRYANDVITVPLRGGTYEFHRVSDAVHSAYYPRGQPSAPYRYAPPPATGDGWPVASVEDVGIARDSIERFVQMLIDLPMDSLSTVQIHSLLIARHGKLVVEEYLHGYDRDQPHDTRSASKSWTATLIGAAMQAGVPIQTSTPVYQTLLETLPATLDPRKKAMTLEHLLTMTAGFNCDPDDPNSADEDQISDRGVVDWYRYTLDVPLISAPGEKVFYCSAEPNLAAGMLAKVAHEHLPEMFERLVARPLHMGNYHLWLTPLGEAYGGGGHKFLPRDFLKLAQLMVNDGKWEGRQIVSAEWARQSTSPLRDLSPTQKWGYLWNVVDYPYQGRTVRAFFAGGNGGQVFMGIPELDLVIGFTGGNYSDRVMFTSQQVYVPRYILPAVR